MDQQWRALAREAAVAAEHLGIGATAPGRLHNGPRVMSAAAAIVVVRRRRGPRAMETITQEDFVVTFGAGLARRP
jgi:plasmid stabilization system protein ParE